MQRMSGTLAINTSVHFRLVISDAGIPGGAMTPPPRFALMTSADFTQPQTTARLPASPRPQSGRPAMERRVARLEYLENWTDAEPLLLVVASSEEDEEEGSDDAIGEH